MSLQVVQMGDPVLRKQAVRVDDVFDSSIQTLIDDMIDAMHHQRGIGLAAPQVGHSKQICIVAPNQTCKPPYDSMDSGLVLINPTIETINQAVTNDWEGCLSIPGLRGLVPRKCNIRVQYTNRYGEQKSETYSGFTARIFLHEIDHLHGVLFLDYIADIKKDLITDAYYEQLMATDP